MKQKRIAISILIIATCFALRGVLEQHPLTHVLVQLPVLAAAGYILIERPPNWTTVFDPTGLFCLVIATTFCVYWMLPRSIDAALVDGRVETLKFFSLPFFVGVPLRLVWTRLHPNLRGFLKAQCISMLGVLAFLYTHSPVRICNAYLESAQEQLGYGFLWLAGSLTIYWVMPLFVGESRQANLHNSQIAGT